MVLDRLTCLICSKPAERCHIKSRGAGGPDDDWNILYACHDHHMIQHSVGWKKYLERYPDVKRSLESKGWEITEFNGRFLLTHPKLT